MPSFGMQRVQGLHRRIRRRVLDLRRKGNDRRDQYVTVRIAGTHGISMSA